MPPSSDFADLFAELNASGAEYLVIGAHALAAHGVVRATKDLDVWVRPAHDNATRVHAALARFGAPLTDVTVDDFARPGIVFQIGLPPVRIDITTIVDGIEFEEAWRERVPTRFADHPIHVMSRDHLIRNKRATGRTQDLADIEQLERRET